MERAGVTEAEVDTEAAVLVLTKTGRTRSGRASGTTAGWHCTTTPVRWSWAVPPTTAAAVTAASWREEEEEEEASCR